MMMNLMNGSETKKAITIEPICSLLDANPLEFGYPALAAFKVSYKGGESASVGFSRRGCFSMTIGGELKI